MGEPMTEDQAIAALHKLAKRWPPSLWLFSACGTLCVMRFGENGEKVWSGTGVDQAALVDVIDIPNDGGDW